MVDAAHDRDDGGARQLLHIPRRLFDGLDELVLDRRLFERLGAVAHLLDDEYRLVFGLRPG